MKTTSTFTLTLDHQEKTNLEFALIDSMYLALEKKRSTRGNEREYWQQCFEERVSMLRTLRQAYKDRPF